MHKKFPPDRRQKHQKMWRSQILSSAQLPSPRKQYSLKCFHTAQNAAEGPLKANKSVYLQMLCESTTSMHSDTCSILIMKQCKLVTCYKIKDLCREHGQQINNVHSCMSTGCPTTEAKFWEVPTTSKNWPVRVVSLPNSTQNYTLCHNRLILYCVYASLLGMWRSQQKSVTVRCGFRVQNPSHADLLSDQN